MKEHIINVFEKRIHDLIKITDLQGLPKWTDTDVIGAHCLINQYRKLSKKDDKDAKTNI